MQVGLRTTRAEVSAKREALILEAWPIGKQLEAHHDAANGKPAKLDRMNAEIAAIKTRYPFPED